MSELEPQVRPHRKDGIPCDGYELQPIDSPVAEDAGPKRSTFQVAAILTALFVSTHSPLSLKTSVIFSKRTIALTVHSSTRPNDHRHSYTHHIFRPTLRLRIHMDRRRISHRERSRRTHLGEAE